MSANSRIAYVADLPDNVLVHSLAQISGLECLLVGVARPTSWFVVWCRLGTDFD